MNCSVRRFIYSIHYYNAIRLYTIPCRSLIGICKCQELSTNRSLLRHKFNFPFLRNTSHPSSPIKPKHLSSSKYPPSQVKPKCCLVNKFHSAYPLNFVRIERSFYSNMWAHIVVYVEVFRLFGNLGRDGAWKGRTESLFIFKRNLWTPWSCQMLPSCNLKHLPT